MPQTQYSTIVTAPVQYIWCSRCKTAMAFTREGFCVKCGSPWPGVRPTASYRWAGRCKSCFGYAWMDEDGGCPRGHGPGDIADVALAKVDDAGNPDLIMVTSRSRSRWNPEQPPDPYASAGARPAGESVRQSVRRGAGGLFFIVWFTMTLIFGLLVASEWGNTAGNLGVLVGGYLALLAGAWFFTRIVDR